VSCVRDLFPMCFLWLVADISTANFTFTTSQPLRNRPARCAAVHLVGDAPRPHSTTGPTGDQGAVLGVRCFRKDASCDQSNAVVLKAHRLEALWWHASVAPKVRCARRSGLFGAGDFERLG
jgi:hypothetical protein